jgi:hypothetical protein
VYDILVGSTSSQAVTSQLINLYDILVGSTSSQAVTSQLINVYDILVGSTSNQAVTSKDPKEPAQFSVPFTSSVIGCVMLLLLIAAFGMMVKFGKITLIQCDVETIN